MKQCRRCKCNRLEIARESVVRRGKHQYALRWYRCPQCHDVRLSYRPLDTLPGYPPPLPARDQDLDALTTWRREDEAVLSR